MKEVDRGDADPAHQGPDLGATRETQEQSAEEVDERDALRPVDEVAELTPLSAVRIRTLLKDGRIEGEFFPDEGYGHGLWRTTINAVLTYKEQLPSPAEFGRRGGRPRKNRV